VRKAILARLADRAFDTTTLAFLVGYPEGLVAKHVHQLITEGQLKPVVSSEALPAGSPRRLIVQVA